MPRCCVLQLISAHVRAGTVMWWCAVGVTWFSWLAMAGGDSRDCFIVPYRSKALVSQVRCCATCSCGLGYP